MNVFQMIVSQLPGKWARPTRKLTLGQKLTSGTQNSQASIKVVLGKDYNSSSCWPDPEPVFISRLITMSRTIAFGRDVLGSADVDLEDLLGQLTGDEVQSLVDEMASDPDDKHLPASVRNSYRCNKEPTGKLNRDSLITHINEEGKFQRPNQGRPLSALIDLTFNSKA